MLWCLSLSCSKNCFLALFYSNGPNWLQISLRSFSKESAILSWIKKWKCNFWGKKKERGNTHTLQTSALLCPFQRDYSSLTYTLSQPLNTVIYVDTAILVIGNICYKKSFELFSRISKDWRYTEMLCFKRACVWACLFFSRGILTSYSCSDVKEMDRKTWCTCKVVVFLTKTYCFFCHSRCRRGRRIRLLKLTRLEGWSSLSG